MPAPARRPALATWLCAAALAALTAALALTVTGPGDLGNRDVLHRWYVLDGVLFLLAYLALRRVPARRVRAMVAVGGLAVAAAGLLAPPRTSDDAYRYLWDGKVQAAGISPYTYAPDAPQLAGLRAQEHALFPDLSRRACTRWNDHEQNGICTHINRPSVHTIYPPVAEGWFLALDELGGSHGVRAAQAGGALLATGTTAAMLVVLRRRRLPEHRAALWAWFPPVPLWAVNDAHCDTLGVLLVVAGFGVLTTRRRAGAGALLGLAISAKLVPALAVPGALAGVLGRRPRLRDLVAPVTALAVFAATYLPYVLASGWKVLGYLPGYLQEEGYDRSQPTRFGLLRLLLPAPLAPYAAALVMLAVLAYVLRRGDPERPCHGALLVTGTALLLAAPAYPWYALLVVALAALDGRWEWLGLAAAGEALYLTADPGVQQPAYAAALYLVLGVAVVRRFLRLAELPVPAPAPRTDEYGVISVSPGKYTWSETAGSSESLTTSWR